MIKVNPENPEPESINLAARVIKNGGLVAFPTETVYGLGANALDEKAAFKIYQAKKRPQDNPLIVHIHSPGELDKLASNVPRTARILMEKFWPGPLTIVLEKSGAVPYGTTGGLDTVAVRMPRHPVALALIRESGVPIAAPSANISGRPSPTTAGDVYEDLAGRVDIILDGGPCEVGVESTVLDLTGEVPVILRPGGVTREELEAVLGRVELDPGLAEGQKPKSPGQKYKHYSPKARVLVVEGPIEAQVRKITELAKKLTAEGKKVGIMATVQTRGYYETGCVLSVGDREAPLTISSNLFSVLRKFDKLGVEEVLAEGIPETGLGLAVMNRLRKAAGYNIIKLE
ncbi:translation factor SUA5 [Thermosediminibacter oceani DSM 16646]|uniref:Threonylcarbamoyl-AMP synthase n=1 Tax=Thermosediminibacter oceani (strain ATCC BAA-1034 / DSM 16646 / JW/IW-1228P) TaxID=555079 RepID=D9S006_THEOJ|nr:translation factor SUA5 [Thermosediminibacter oceani DSM 16646]